ncbi:Uncharacterised protein [Mycobacteroides abscessus subsp. abscessus]|nr:Uncharacterised protein [Mycobacteroides abscessus subsp. abscessus]
MSIGVKGRNRLLGDYYEVVSFFLVVVGLIVAGVSVPVYEENRVLR